MASVWIITEGFNDYDQHGEYFVAAFDHKPSITELDNLLGGNEQLSEWVDKGGGRQGVENSWYYMTEVESGQEYKPYNN